MNVALKGAGLRYIVDHSDSSILVCDVEYVEAVVAVQEDLPKISNIIATRCGVVTETTVPEDWIELGALMQASSEENPNASVEMGQIAGIMYTSGTTGNPKGVVQRHGPIRMGADSGLAPKLEPTDILYTCLPLFHANALSLSVRRALTHGLPVAVARRFSASRFWSDIRRYGATTFNALGAMMPILMKQPEREDDADNPVRVVFSAACPASVWEAFENRFDVHIHEIYAAVDGGGFATVNPGSAPVGSIGKPTNTYRIVDDDGEDVAVGTPGELWWKIDNPGSQTVEYYKNVDASNDKIAGGWLHTGDVVRADAEGLSLFRRPQDGVVASTRREHLVLRGRTGDQQTSGGARIGRIRRAFGPWRGRCHGCGRAEAGADAHARGAHRALRIGHGILHGPPVS